MMTFRPAILYVDDEQANLDTFKRSFGSDYVVKTCLSGEEALKAVEREDFPIVIADQRMPGMTGIELCERLVRSKPQTIRMILTAYAEPEILLDAINRGHVHDYIVKPWKRDQLKPVIEKAFEDWKQRHEKLAELEKHATKAGWYQRQAEKAYDPDVIGASSGLKATMEVLRRAAPTDSTILLLGETGTGKEVLAHAIHKMSQRSNGPFIPVHCAALPATLMESEFFGYEKGAFTGADHPRPGYFEMASGGTIFLDEIGEISLDIQVKLLRVLQERKIWRLGGKQSIDVDVRIVAATNKDLKKAVKDGTFREDLYYRLNVIQVTIPPLRDRRTDIPEMAAHFLKTIKQRVAERTLSLSPAAVDQLCRYDWPGNVRELRNIIERAVILSPGPEIEPQELNLNVEEILAVEKVDPASLSASSYRSQLDQKESNLLTDALKKADGNLSEAARLLGVARSTLFYRMKKFGLM